MWFITFVMTPSTESRGERPAGTAPYMLLLKDVFISLTTAGPAVLDGNLKTLTTTSVLLSFQQAFRCLKKKKKIQEHSYNLFAKFP